jgi:hypothetical protein
MSGSNRINLQPGDDVGMEGLNVHGESGAKDDVFEGSSSEGRSQLFRPENRAEIVRIGCGVVAISPFRVDVPASSKGIGLSTKLARTEADNKIKAGKELRPASLTASK